MLRATFLKFLVELPLLVFYKYVKLLTCLLRIDRYLYHQRLNQLAESVIPRTIVSAGLTFDATSKTQISRARRLLTKEPDLINWLDDHLTEMDNFYDIGANVGTYSIYAARKCKLVVAIEPESSNYAVLNRNIFLNALDRKLQALNLALHDDETLSILHINNFQPGKSGHSFHVEIESPVDSGETKFHQAVIGMPLDTLVERYSLPCPNLVKIDVDGNEARILDGMEKILKNLELRSIAIEINQRQVSQKNVEQKLLGYGFEMLTDPRYSNEEYSRIGIPNVFFLRAK
jgi:FkbM family methyltransferase